MNAERRPKMREMIETLKQQRDELKVQIHLGKEDLKDEWDKLEEKYHAMNEEYAPTKDATSETVGHVWDAIKQVGEELRDGYHRIRKSL